MAVNVANSSAGSEGSVDSVADMLVSKMLAKSGDTPNVGDEEKKNDKASPAYEQAMGKPDDADDNSAGDQQADGEEEGAEEVEESKAERDYDISEDDLLEVTVDGEVLEVSIKDLKKAYSAEGAVQKRLKEATDTRKETVAIRQKAVEDTTKMRNSLLALVQQIDTALHTPNIAAPDKALSASNPQAYIRQMEAYNQEQHNITESRKLLVAALQQNAQQLDAMKAEAKKEQVALLQATLEPLSNPSTREEAAKDILGAVSHYGFTDQDMNEVVDHRLYLMAYDAMQYRKLLAKTKKGKPSASEVKENAVKQARTLKTNASRRDRGITQQNQRQVKVLHDQAAKTGKVDDIAALLVQKQTARKR